ncbi:hypothetical protein Bca52824_065054 [Brassica carinata]|uniref:Uncharacterized protein n=1 Tax=Brassica carinata TaxID=52824 RepID=A0A8X7QHL7_BRACI|nr:hypothetical protein Bca52824_065054 [Brassica carinata]
MMYSLKHMFLIIGSCYPTQQTAIDKFMVYELIKTSGIGTIKRSPVSRWTKMVLRFLLQLYQEASTDCLSLFRVSVPALNTCFPTCRYRVEMTIADDTAEGLFVCFDGVMTKLRNIRNYETGLLLVRDYSISYHRLVRFFSHTLAINHWSLSLERV